MNQPTPVATLPFTFAGLYYAALWGIRNQNYERSTIDGEDDVGTTSTMCVYRTDRPNVKCAFGHALPDENYHPSLEDKRASVVMARMADALGTKAVYGTARTADERYTLENFASTLQQLHDHVLRDGGPDAWERGMEALTLQYYGHGLEYVPPTPVPQPTT